MTTISIPRQQPDISIEQRSSYLIDAITALIFSILLILIINYPLHVNSDASLFLETGSLILDGKTPYVDFNEINFPLVMYLHAVPVGIGRAVGVNPILVFSVLVFALAAGSCLMLRHLLIRHYEGNVPFALRLFPVAIALYTLYLFVAGQFGQREHLFILLFLPGFVLRWMRWEGDRVDWRLALLIGVAAGVGAALKPQFLLIAFAPEAYWIAAAVWTRRKSAFTTIRRALLAPEVVGFVLFGAIYALALLLSPEMRNALFNQILPYVSSNYYTGNIGLSPLTLLVRLDTLVIWLALALTLPVVIRNRPLARPLLVLTVAAIVVFCLQGKGWYYHRIPVIFGVALLVTMALVEQQSRRPMLGALLKVLMVPLLYGIIMLGGMAQLSEPYSALRDTILKYTRPGDAVMIMDSYVSVGVPLLVQTGRASSGPNLSGFAIGENPQEDPDLAAYIHSAAQTIQASEPPLVLINAQPTCTGCAPGYGMLSYLQQVGFVQQLAPGYTDMGRVNRFEVYVRK